MENTSKPKTGERKRKASSSMNNSPTFVWARDGNHEGAQEHAAYLLQTSDVPSAQLIDEDDEEYEYVYVRWCSTGTISRIRKNNVSTEELSSRRCRRAAATATATRQASKSKGRLSLSKQQRQHWRDQQKVQKRQKSGSENKPNSMECDVISIGSRSSRIGPHTVSVDDSTYAGEEKKDDDVTIQSSKPISSLPRNLLVQEETKPQLQQLQDKKKDGNVTIQSSKQIKSISCNPLAQPQPQLDKTQQNDVTVTMQSNKTVSALSCNPSAEEKDLHTETKPQVKEQNETSVYSYTYRSSAYVQHLAEACNIIMSDARWRTLKQSGTSSREVSLFSWEEGDDLSAVKAFMSLYEDPTNQEAVKQKDDIEDDIIFERAMNLYSRIYHRKGPWLDLADLYVRYYAPKVRDNTEMESESSKTSFSNHQSALQSLFVDILRLESMGLVRSFESEYECGIVAGQVRTSQSGGGGMKRGVILSAEERKEVLRMLGGGKSPKAGVMTQSDCKNEVLAQMQSQKTLISAFAATKSKTSSLLPVRKHVDKVLLRKLASKVVSLSKSEEGQVYTPRRAEVEMALKMIESEWKDATTESPMQQSQSSLMSTIRLREAPLQTLRRVMRLFLCAGGGPGSMRGNGTNGWRSCLVEGDWHKVEYPGLNSRFGLEAYPLQKYFAALPEHNSVTRVFESLNEFRLFEIGAELRSSIDQASEAFETEKMIRRRNEKSSESESRDKIQPSVVSVVDVWHLLTKDGRLNLVRKVLSCRDDQNNELELLTICRRIEDDIHQLDTIRESMSEHESLILCTSIVCRWLLQVCIDNSISLSSLRSRPWLRHLSFDAILTYIVWDAVPFLEKRDLYMMASSRLMMILFGTEIKHFCFDGPDSLSNQFQCYQYAQYLLPRRNRGKAIERLLIDLTHAHRKSHKEKSNKPTPLDSSPILGFCRLLLRHTATSNSIPFSSIRNLARRLKAPLIKTMDGLSNDEIQLLRIRLDNVSSSDKIESCSGYRDWSPETDIAVANAISNDRDESGGRCAFVGWESNDHGNRPETTRSLNVEELALELYHSAKLPNNNDKDSASNVPKGGWEGWHNEGGHARKLFRIIFLQEVLDNMSVDDPTIFLTPYQHSPHDLHVGYQKVESDDHSKVSLIHGFYERRRNSVEAFLSKLSQQTDQSICDLVYFSVKARWNSHANDESRIKDVPLLRDVAELRTLSMVAAGLGGQALSSMFRALAFDYRHYSGGLPDLLLARARYHLCKDEHFVDLGEWIGEAFCEDYIEEENLHRSISMLADRDDDFLGCSKNVDSGHNKFSSKKKRQKISVVPAFPAKVQLVHDEKQVIVDSLFVEVKSANDRLVRLHICVNLTSSVHLYLMSVLAFLMIG